MEKELFESVMTAQVDDLDNKIKDKRGTLKELCVETGELVAERRRIRPFDEPPTMGADIPPNKPSEYESGSDSSRRLEEIWDDHCEEHYHLDTVLEERYGVPDETGKLHVLSDIAMGTSVGILGETGAVTFTGVSAADISTMTQAARATMMTDLGWTAREAQSAINGLSGTLSEVVGSGAFGSMLSFEIMMLESESSDAKRTWLGPLQISQQVTVADKDNPDAAVWQQLTPFLLMWNLEKLKDGYLPIRPGAYEKYTNLLASNQVLQSSDGFLFYPCAIRTDGTYIGTTNVSPNELLFFNTNNISKLTVINDGTNPFYKNNPSTSAINEPVKIGIKEGPIRNLSRWMVIRNRDEVNQVAYLTPLSLEGEAEMLEGFPSWAIICTLRAVVEVLEDDKIPNAWYNSFRHVIDRY